MDRLPDAALPAGQIERAAECSLHGPYASRNLFRNVWSRCPQCQDAEQAAKEAEQRRREEAGRARRLGEMLDAAAIPARFVGRNFDNFRATTPEQLRALTIARDFAENFPEHSRRGAGLILAGQPGTGKSHLAAAILQALMPAAVRYMTCMDLIRAVRDTWRRDSAMSESQLLASLSRLDLLVIDEVGVQYGTEGEQTILFDVIDRRYRDMRPLILMTNQNAAGFKGFIGERSFDRMKEVAQWVPFEWPSYRPQARKEAL